MSKEERKKYETEKSEALRIEVEKERCVFLNDFSSQQNSFV